MCTIWNAINPRFHCPRPLRIPCIQHATTWLMHDEGISCRQEPAFSGSQSSETQISAMQRQSLPLTETCFPKGVLRGPLRFLYALVILTYACASVEPRDLSLQHSTVVTPVMITATRDVTPNAIPKPENKNMQDHFVIMQMYLGQDPKKCMLKC